MKNTNKKNLIIAEFMQKGSEGFGLYDYNGKYYKLDELKFHTSWDWLMPVVESIFERLDSRDNSATEIKKYMLLCCLDETYNAVVEFINQYNKNK
jgi:hypothetical protein